MKSRLLPALCASLCLSVSALAQYTGTSNFDDLTNWLTPVGTGGGVLAINTGVLEYTSTLTTNQAYTAWTLGNAPYASDWAARVDVHLANSGLTSGQWVNLNFSAANSADVPGDGSGLNMDMITVAIDRYYDAGTVSGFEGTMNAFISPDNATATPVYANSATTDASLAITFNSTTKMISTFYDADGVIGGDNWVALTSYNIGSSTYNWGMGPSDTFSLVLIGSSSSIGITTGQAYFDNFAVTAVPEPSTYAGILGACALGLVVIRRRFCTKN